MYHDVLAHTYTMIYTYHYIGNHRDGEVRSGYIRGESKKVIALQLEQIGITVVTLTRVEKADNASVLQTKEAHFTFEAVGEQGEKIQGNIQATSVDTAKAFLTKEYGFSRITLIPSEAPKDTVSNNQTDKQTSPAPNIPQATLVVPEKTVAVIQTKSGKDETEQLHEVYKKTSDDLLHAISDFWAHVLSRKPRHILREKIDRVRELKAEKASQKSSLLGEASSDSFHATFRNIATEIRLFLLFLIFPLSLMLTLSHLIIKKDLGYFHEASSSIVSNRGLPIALFILTALYMIAALYESMESYDWIKKTMIGCIIAITLLVCIFVI